MDLLNLNCQTWIFLFYCLANRLVTSPILFEFTPHYVISILDRFLDLFLWSTCKIKLHDCVILELAFSDQIEFTFSFRKYGEGSYIVLSVCHFLEIFDNEVWVLSELNEKVLIGFDPLELPIVALKYKIEVDLCVTCQLYFQAFGKPMLILNKHLDSNHFRLLQNLH